MFSRLFSRLFPSTPVAGAVNKHPVFIGTHHKAGTNWLASVFRAIARSEGLNMLEGEQAEDLSGVDILFQDHSVFDFTALGASRGLHMIRDPRDVIVSGCYYHQHADEEWLHIKRRRYGDRSYAEAINSYSSMEDRLRFEMEHIGVLTLQDMAHWDYRQSNIFEVKYEDLIEDRDMQLFGQLFAFLRKDDSALAHCNIEKLLGIARQKSLFSGEVQASNHVRSGKVRQWPEYFTPALSQRFLQLYGDLLQDLGYEADNGWADGAGGAIITEPEFHSLTIYDVLYHPQDPEYQQALDSGLLLR